MKTEEKCPNCGHWHIMYHRSSALKWLQSGIHRTITTTWECVNCGIMFTVPWAGGIFWVTPKRFSWWQRLLGREQPQVMGVIDE